MINPLPPATPGTIGQLLYSNGSGEPLADTATTDGSGNFVATSLVADISGCTGFPVTAIDGVIQAPYGLFVGVGASGVLFGIDGGTGYLTCYGDLASSQGIHAAYAGIGNYTISDDGDTGLITNGTFTATQFYGLLDYSNLTNAPDLSAYAQLSGAAFVGDISAVNVTGDITNCTGSPALNGENFTGINKTLFTYVSSVGNSTTSETDLYTSTVAANQLNATGDCLETEYGGVFVSSGTATRQLRVYFAGTAIFDSGALTLSLSDAWTIYVTISRVSSTTVRYMVSMTTEGAALSAYTAVGELGSIDLTTTNVAKITGQAAGIGAASNDIVAKIGRIEFKPA